MAFAVLVGTGYSKMTVRFPTPEQALKEARDQMEGGAEKVIIRIADTGEEFTTDQFEEKMREASPS